MYQSWIENFWDFSCPLTYCQSHPRSQLGVCLALQNWTYTDTNTLHIKDTHTTPIFHSPQYSTLMLLFQLNRLAAQEWKSPRFIHNTPPRRTYPPHPVPTNWSSVRAGDVSSLARSPVTVGQTRPRTDSLAGHERQCLQQQLR